MQQNVLIRLTHHFLKMICIIIWLTKQFELISLAKNWAEHDPDTKTKQQVLDLIKDNDIDKLTSLFSGDLEFGTAGLRSEIGPGQSRMNRAVVIRATYGLCQYLLNKYPNKKPKLIVGNDLSFLRHFHFLALRGMFVSKLVNRIY